MLRNIKRRVKSFGGDSHRRSGDAPPSTPLRPGTPETAESQPSTKKKKKKTAAKVEDLMSKIPHLSNFDKCIETSDAITASSSAQQTESIFTDRKDASSGLPDCSLLVSPEGDLLLVPTGENPELMFRSPKNRVKPPADPLVSPSSEEHYGEDDFGSPKSSFSELMLNGKDDYESSIFIGDDLHGEKTLNRFSAKGWSVPATSYALEQTNHSIQALAAFCENIISANKEHAARATIACDNLKNDDVRKTGSKLSDQQWEIIDPRATDFEYTDSRVGPFHAESSTVRAAVSAVENYYRIVAEKEAKRFREASLQRKGVLHAIEEATRLFDKRIARRQLALQEATRRARIMEDRLAQCKKLSEKRWQAVYRAEEKATKKVGELLSTRSRERQKVRLRLLQQDQNNVAGDAAQSNIMSEDVWNLVSSVADTMDHGSYEPMCLNGLDAASFISDEASTTSSVNVEREAEPSIPMANREEIEQELGLPELRRAAMQADEEIQDAADALLNILSVIDTTRRSARLAAETSLVSAGNAQAACLRSMVQLEREELEERLLDLKETEEALDSMDVRLDIDKYICDDKQECGGSSHLGEDDDGGIASALATLSSHVDKAYGDDSLSHRSRTTSSTIVDDDEKDEEGMTPAAVNEAIVKLFAKNDCLRSDAHVKDDNVCRERSEFEKNLELLCRAASGSSSVARTRRSSLCYSLNSQRGPNARVGTQIQFDAICKLFSAVLSGCNEEDDGNAKLCMLMMLAQTFYIDEADAEGGNSCLDESLGSSPSRHASRKRRIYVKSQLINHAVWSNDEFWDVALSQQISESLMHSGVMANFESNKRSVDKEYIQHRRTWHDLNFTERIEAASQVHAVVFAQLGALAHSMIELGCGLERSCAFVRRMAIRNQLPSSQKTMLLKHLMDRDDVGRRESHLASTAGAPLAKK